MRVSLNRHIVGESNMFYEAYRAVSYPCYWLVADDTFWSNPAAQETDAPGFKPDHVRILLSALPKIQPPAQAAGACTPFMLQGLALLPHPEGYFAFRQEEALSSIDPFSNNLRAPLADILVTLQTMSRRLQEADDEVAISLFHQMSTLQTNCYQLLRLTTNMELFHLAQHKANRLQTIELGSFLKELCDKASKTCQEQGVGFEADLPDDIIAVEADPRLLSNAFFNLIRNSLQYTQEGNHIRVSLVVTRQRAILTVSDKGLGIKPEALPHIWEPYYSADPYLDSEERPGLGLGLALVQSAVGAMGGTLAAESRFGEGTAITLSLPLSKERFIALESAAGNYTGDLYAPEYIQLCGFCRLPVL